MKLIRGAPGSGKTRQVFREFREALSRGESNLRIIVPTATLVRHFQHELARDGVVFPPRCVLSLNRFLTERAGDVRLVPDGLLRAIVRDCLTRLPFSEFAAVAETEGMSDTIIETIGLFENAGCTPDRLASVRRLGPLAKPFEKLWRAVGEAVRQRGFFMRAEWIRAAAGRQEPARIWLDGFLNFSPLEQDFLAALEKTCDLTVALPACAAADEIYRLALKLGAQDQLLPGSARKPPATTVRAATPEREADEVARRILLLHEAGTPFRDIGVALRDSDTYVPLLKGTFERFGIPARFYFSSSLRKHPVATFLNGLIACALGGWEFESAVRALRAHPRWGLRADFDRFEFAVREAMPGRGAAELAALCDSEWLRNEIEACLKIDAWKTGALKPAEWVKRLESLAVNLYRPGIAGIPRDHFSIEAERSHAGALRAWIAAVESVSPFWTDAAPISLADFWSVASAAVETTMLHPMDERADVVHVMNAWEARQWDMASLFVCGMTDRDFPRRHAQNLLFPDGDIEILRRAGLLLRKTADHQNEENWLVESLKTRARDSLFLSYPMHDAGGRTLQCSRLIDSSAPAEAATLSIAEPRCEAPQRAAAGRLDSPALHAELARLHQSISLTSLEDLALCRFKFFSRKTLRLEAAPEAPDRRLTPRVTGSILHLALERWLSDRTRDFVEVFENAFDETCRKEHIPAGYRMEVERIAFREIAQRVSANDLWKPDSSEAEVQLAIQFPGGVSVTCRVDRIDRFGDDCVIIDYKSSKPARVEKLVTSAIALQGPLYALAVGENRGLNPVAMMFWAVREDERYGWGTVPGRPDIELSPIPENWMEEAKARTIERLTEFLAGRVHPHPEDAEQCRWCDYAAACRVEEAGLVRIGAGRSV